MPGFEWGLVECAKGSLASDEKDCALFLAASCERSSPLTSDVDILALASVASNEDGWVKVWTAMVGVVS
jgi:hypothetical protein